MPRGQQGLPAFAFCRHRGAALHAGDDDGLADGGSVYSAFSAAAAPQKLDTPGGIIVGNALGVQHVHLLPDGTVKAGVAGVQAHGDLTRSFHLPHHIQHLLQRHFSAVINGAICLCKAQQGRVHQTARIDDAVGFLKQGRAPAG